MSEGLPRNQGHHPEGCTRDDIACAEMMEIIRWENEGGRIWMSPQPSRSQDDIRERDAGTDVAKRLLRTYMTDENNSQEGSYQ
jgi:hypothetical protein